jgi:hypothetical protein
MAHQGIQIARAEPAEAHLVSEILVEAASWLEQRGTPMWKLDERRANAAVAKSDHVCVRPGS